MIAIPDTWGHLVEGIRDDLSEEPIARQNLNRETGWRCPHPRKVIPARRYDNIQSPEMAANPQRPEKRKNVEARMG